MSAAVGQPATVADVGEHTITALVQDIPATLARVVASFRRRGFNITSLTVGNSEKPGMSRMTIVVKGNPQTINMAAVQLERLVEVVEASDITHSNIVWRELALIKVARDPDKHTEIGEIGQIFRAQVVDMSPSRITYEVTGSTEKINSMISLLEPFGVLEVMRTGRVATMRHAEERATP